MDGQVRLDRGFVKLGGVDIDLNLEGARRERLPVIAGLANVETRSEDQQNVGILYREVSGAVADGALASAKERVIGCDEVMGPGGGYGYAQPVEEFVKFGNCMGGADAGASEDHGALGAADSVEDFAAIGFRARTDRPRTCPLRFQLLRSHPPRDHSREDWRDRSVRPERRLECLASKDQGVHSVQGARRALGDIGRREGSSIITAYLVMFATMAMMSAS